MKDEIRLVEKLAMNAWPAEVVEPLDGWRMRWHRAPSRRVNSVWPNEWEGQIPLAIKLERVEFFYALREQLARYQICPAAQPAGLDEILEARGYTVDARTAVQVAEVRKVLERLRPSLLPPMGEERKDIQVFEMLTDEWLEGYCLAQDASLNQMSYRRLALSLVQEPSVYVLVQVDGQDAAVGRGVLEQDWLGVFGMSTRAEFRRRGLATSVLSTLARWAQEHGAGQMYLQVMENNPGAKALYENVGFETLYHYHYREKKLSAH